MFVLSHLRSRTIAVLGLLCAAFALVAFSELDAATSSPASESSIPSRAPEDAAAAGTLSPPSFSLPPLESFAAVTERPLFSPNRRPAEISSGESDAWSSFVLAGIIITPELREAMVLHSQPPTPIHIHEGEAMDGWTLESLSADHAVFRHDVEEHELKLNVITNAKPSAAPEPRLAPANPGRNQLQPPVSRSS